MSLGSPRVVLPARLRRAIVDHARAERPRECCGFLLGRGHHVRFVVRARNIAEEPTRYRIDDRAHIEVRRLLRAFTPPLAIVGVYHSHPSGPPRPSPSDVAEAHYPEWIHVIADLSSVRPRLGAFRIAAGNVQSLDLGR